MIDVPQRDCPIIMNDYVAEIMGYGRLAGSGDLADLVTMTATFGLKFESDRVRYYRHVKWLDGREWTKRVTDIRGEISNDVKIGKAMRHLSLKRVV